MKRFNQVCFLESLSWLRLARHSLFSGSKDSRSETNVENEEKTMSQQFSIVSYRFVNSDMINLMAMNKNWIKSFVKNNQMYQLIGRVLNQRLTLNSFIPVINETSKNLGVEGSSVNSFLGSRVKKLKKLFFRFMKISRFSQNTIFSKKILKNCSSPDDTILVELRLRRFLSWPSSLSCSPAESRHLSNLQKQKKKIIIFVQILLPSYKPYLQGQSFQITIP